MTKLTSDRDTPRRNGDQFEFEAAAEIFAGAMVCVNGDGKAVPASATAGLSPVAGVAERRAAAGERVPVRRGVFAFDASSDDAPTRADIGRECWAADDCTLKKTTAENAPAAGIILDVTDDGVWVNI